MTLIDSIRLGEGKTLELKAPKWGSGIQRIKSACTAVGLTEPHIREKGDFVDVEFYRPVADTGGLLADIGGYERKRTIENDKVSDSARSAPNSDDKVSDMPDCERLGHSANDYERLGHSANDYELLRTIISGSAPLKPEEAKILLHLIAHHKIGRKEATGLLGLGNTKTYTLFSGLIEKGLILRRGQGRSTYYVLARPPQGDPDV